MQSYLYRLDLGGKSTAKIISLIKLLLTMDRQEE